MATALPPYRSAQVLVVGDVMLDRYWYGPSRRISPEAPVPIVNVQRMEERPGGAANVAMNIASLGARVRLVGFTGADDDGRVLNDTLRTANVDSQLIAHTAYSTLTKLRVISQNQQLLRIDFEGSCLQPDVTALLLMQIEQSLPLLSPRVVVLSDYGKGALDDIQPLIQLGRTAGIPVLVDPKGSDFSRYRGATLLTPNLAEFETVVGPCHNEDQLVVRGMQLLDDLQLAALLITRSKQGMTLLRQQRPPLHLPTQAREICDVTGAGDTVIAVLAASLAAGTLLEDACILANTAAGLVVGKLGTATVSSMELEKNLSLEDTPFGMMNELSLKQAVAKARQRGERIVMTNGCFDILHAGHVSYLARARQLGDRLIVAVNSDASIRLLKGDGRPINQLGHRMQILSALSSVDWVVPFYEETPERLITEILPDFLVKGGDYLPETIAGAQAVQKAGGEVQVLDFVSECSTTKVIQRILHGKS